MQTKPPTLCWRKPHPFQFLLETSKSVSRGETPMHFVFQIERNTACKDTSWWQVEQRQYLSRESVSPESFSSWYIYASSLVVQVLLPYGSRAFANGHEMPLREKSDACNPDSTTSPWLRVCSKNKNNWFLIIIIIIIIWY